MDVAWIIHNPFVEVLQHCIDAVAASGVSQRVLSLADYSAREEQQRDAAVAQPIARVYAESPKIIVWCLHVGNPDIKPHYFDSPAQLNIVIEHDLFTTHPEGNMPTQHASEILFFTRQHWMSRHEYNAPNRRFTPSRWYKVDGYLRPDAQAYFGSPGFVTHDKWRHAMFADSLLYTGDTFPHAEAFDAVYEKPWKQPSNRPGTLASPVDISGPAGVVAAQRLAGFWIARKSSILAEAVFHGCIPVIHQQPEKREVDQFYVEEREIDPYPLTEVVIDKGHRGGGQFIRTKALTTRGDFQGKIRALQNDPALRDAILREIGRQWMFGPLESTPLPSVDEIVLERLGEL